MKWRMKTVPIKDCPDRMFTAVQIFRRHNSDKSAIEGQIEKQHDYFNTLHIHVIPRQPRNLGAQPELIQVFSLFHIT